MLCDITVAGLARIKWGFKLDEGDNKCKKQGEPLTLKRYLIKEKEKEVDDDL